MTDMGLKRRDSSSSDQENDLEWNPIINSKHIKSESSHEEHEFDSSSTKSIIVPK